MTSRKNTSDDRWYATRLSHWFKGAARDLPWRRNRSAYTSLVAELMLQQTQVSRVLERFADFIARFPTPQSLAMADEQDVLAAWQGLGYYRRARHLHQAAKAIVADHAGETPLDVPSLRDLPGVGRYTAGAIASIVGGQAQPIVDGNVRRVLARWHGVREPGDQWCWDHATSLVEHAAEPGIVNEALMDLGATVCTPVNPRCSSCPVRQRCVAHAENSADIIPQPRRAAQKRTIHHHCMLISRRGRVLLEQRPASGLWANMWQPVTLEAESALSQDELSDHAPFTVSSLHQLSAFTHQTTHRRVEFHVFRASTRVRRGHWVDAAGVAAIPMSNPHRKIIRLAR